jgi:hypothetical protein
MWKRVLSELFSDAFNWIYIYLTNIYICIQLSVIEIYLNIDNKILLKYLSIKAKQL